MNPPAVTSPMKLGPLLTTFVNVGWPGKKADEKMDRRSLHAIGLAPEPRGV